VLQFIGPYVHPCIENTTRLLIRVATLEDHRWWKNQEILEQQEVISNLGLEMENLNNTWKTFIESMEHLLHSSNEELKSIPGLNLTHQSYTRRTLKKPVFRRHKTIISGS